MNDRSTDEYDEDEDDYLTKLPKRCQKVVQKPKQQFTRWPEDWD